MTEDYSKYYNAIKEKICLHCPDSDDDGQCKLSGGRVCGVELHLEKMIHIVKTITSKKMDDYIEAMRALICDHCANQAESGTCILRQEIECALDSHLALVVDMIEEIDKADQ